MIMDTVTQEHVLEVIKDLQDINTMYEEGIFNAEEAWYNARLFVEQLVKLVNNTTKWQIEFATENFVVLKERV
jgi:hypothetical protein